MAMWTTGEEAEREKRRTLFPDYRIAVS